MKFTTKLLSVALLVGAFINCGQEAKAQSQINVNRPPLENYFVPSSAVPVGPLTDGFIQRWTILEGISKPNRGNTVFTDSYIREAFVGTKYFAEQFDNQLPDPKKVVKSVNGEVKQNLKWHQLDSKIYNVKLYRFGTNTNYENRYGVIFWAVTEINCPNGLNNVRLSAGSNSASMWWIDGEEVLIMSGDRRMVQDDCASKRLNLAPGKHLIRVAVINGPGMSDFCVRFVDESGNAVTNFTINNTAPKKK